MALKGKTLDFSSKARTLSALTGLIPGANVLPLYLFKVTDYEKDPDKIIKEISTQLGTGLFVVRSSSASEDGVEFSNAGHFESILNVDGKNPSAIRKAIDTVISSYESTSKQDEVFVQPQLSNIKMAGVAFTADLDTLAPYYIINYDEGGSSDSVTSGKSSSLKTFVYYKHSPVHCNDEQLHKLVTVLANLENVFNCPVLDVEFAFDNTNDLFIFQVRKISKKNKEDLSEIDLNETLLKIHKKINKLSAPHPNLLGEHAVYGVMPDWNPAEIIGLKPKHLAASLYKELITDNIWAYQRDNYGYRNLRSHPLMLLYLGVPYIDVRVDFNSFIPKNLNENTARKLTEHYLSKLITTPVLHDKVEFEIVHSCFYFNLPQKLKEDLSKYGFSESEIREIQDSLLELTNKIIDPFDGLYKKDLLQAEKLKEKYTHITNSQLSLVDKIYWLIEDCKRYGTLPFAGVARSAFIATQMLRSFEDLGIISREEMEHFNSSLNTVTRDINSDLFQMQSGNLSKKEFKSKYGHLRPGTYDILSKRYDENFEMYFSGKSGSPVKQGQFEFTEKQLKQIKQLINESKLQTSPEELINFIKTSIEGREYVKFVFTKSLSKVLSLIEELAVKYGIKTEDLPFLDIKTILDLYASLDYRDVKDIFERDIQKNKLTYQYTKAVKLPSLITKADDVYFHFLHSEEPNFVTLKNTCLKIVKEEDIKNSSLENKIIFIKSADPGYDFLFTKKIGGLVTQFGGANSHMAVRCAELGIPAVIGAGETNFNSWLKAELLEINCLNKTVKVIA